MNKRLGSHEHEQKKYGAVGQKITKRKPPGWGVFLLSDQTGFLLKNSLGGSDVGVVEKEELIKDIQNSGMRKFLLTYGSLPKLAFPGKFSSQCLTS